MIALIPAPQGGESLDTSWRLLELPAGWVVALIILPISLGIALAAYRSERLETGMRALLVGLRWLALLGLLTILARPVEVRSQERVSQAEILILADDSASMSRRDAYSGDAQASAALIDILGADPGEFTRAEITANLLQGQLTEHLEQRGYDTRLMRFAQRAEPLADSTHLTGRGSATHLGDAVTAALARARGRHVTGLIVLSDGRSNGGLATLDAAQEARLAGIPVHTIVIGDTRPERNLLLELVEVPSSVLEEDEIAITVRVRGRGVMGTESIEVVLEEVSASGTGRTLDQARIQVNSEGQRVTLIAEGQRTGSSNNERRFRISVPPLAEERMVDDNQVSATVRINPERIRVLYVDGYPRWEYRQLKDMLLRADERIEAQLFLLSATPDFPQEATRGLDRLTRVPTERQALLDAYDVIILGDLNPWAISSNPALGQEFVASLTDFVEEGGGLCVIAGEYDMPKAVAGTEFAQLLPVVLDPTGSLAFEVDASVEKWPTLEQPANPHQIVRLHQDPQVNQQLWEGPDGLRGFYWHFPVRGPKPGAQVLLRHPSASLSGSGERDPLLVAGYHPAGRSLFLGLDSTHRWQFRYEHRYHERFWRNVIRWLAIGRLKGGDRRFQLDSLEPEYGLDERVTLEARIQDEDFRPLEAESQEVHLEDPDGRRSTILLKADPTRPGVFRASQDAGRAGNWRAWIEQQGKHLASTQYDVVLPSRENSDPTPDAPNMLALAQRTEGVAVTPGNLSPLLAALPGGQERREPISKELNDAWDRWSTLLGVLALLTLEWILRKRHELI